MESSGEICSWEKVGVLRSWADLHLHSDGNLCAVSSTAKAPTVSNSKLVAGQRGFLRFFTVILDYTASMTRHDFKPSNAEVVTAVLERFIQDYFSQNPLGQLAILALHEGRCEIVSEMGGSMKSQIRNLKDWTTRKPSGVPSAANGLNTALSQMDHLPDYGTREILLLYASNATHDPKELPWSHIIERLQKVTIRLTVISLSPELFILRRLIEAVAFGKYKVATAGEYFENMVREELTPPPWSAEQYRAVKMGFPQQEHGAAHSSETFLCACHHIPRRLLYVCPQCQCFLCDVPSKCKVCLLPNVEAATVAQCSNTLFTMTAFVSHMDPPDARCWCCAQPAPHSCPDCRQVFCHACATYAVETLHQCPGCGSPVLSKRRKRRLSVT